MASSGKHTIEKPSIKGDRLNIMMLVLMYVFQGIITGFSYSFPIIFQNRNVSYADQAEFSFVLYPYTFKIIWAPIVDCIFSKRFGRRKTWVIPTQYLMGIILFYVSMHLEDWLGSEDGTRKPRIRLLALFFFLATLLSAVQDVAVDGWALTMLQRRNVGYAGICQSIGGVVGQFLSNPVFLILDSKNFCNRFRSAPLDHGFVPSAEVFMKNLLLIGTLIHLDFIFYWSLVFVAVTTLILIFKKDNSLEVIEDGENCECRLGLKESYTHTLNIFKLRPILLFSSILLTYSIGFGPSVGICHLKMIDAGITKDTLVLLSMFSLPFQIILSIVFRHHTSGPRAMRCFLRTHTLLLITTIVLATVLFFSPFVKNESQVMPFWYYCILFFFFNVRNVIRSLMVLSVNSYFCRISDPRFGGIYLTLLITMSNLGNSWPVTLSLWAVDPLTIKSCTKIGLPAIRHCYTKVDGFYVESAISAVFSIIWMLWARKKILKLEKLDASEWIFERKKLETVQHKTLMLSNGDYEMVKSDN